MLLDRLIRNMSVSIEPFALCEVEQDCLLELQADEQVTVHFVLTGSGTLQIASHQVDFAPNSLILVPNGSRQELFAVAGDRFGTDAVVGFDASVGSPKPEARVPVAFPEGLPHGVQRMRSLGPDGRADLVVACGRINVRFNGGPALFAHLREPVVIDFSDSNDMRYLFQQVLRESGTNAPGATEMVAVLMNRCLVMAFRRLCDDDECPLPWLRALEDPRLGAALDQMLEQPGDDHSVESLAAEAGMSRTSFAEGFKAAFGVPPMTFLRDIRLRTAADLLRDTKLGTATVAKRVGFASRTHFVDAFRRYTGQTPSDYRKAPYD